MVATPAPVVPPFIQHIVKRKAGERAYAPTRGFGYRYRSYAWRGGRLTIRLVDPRYPNAAKHTVLFAAARYHGTCDAGKLKTLQLDGNRVYWDGTTAWRCLRGVKLSASGPNLPDVGLGRFVSLARRL